MECSQKIDKLLKQIAKTVPSQPVPDLPENPLTEAPEWHDFEHTIWRLSDEIRLAVKTKSTYTFSAQQISAILEIIDDHNARRGRQLLVTLLAYKKYGGHANAIAAHIHDADISGHVIGTLLKMQAMGYAEIIAPFADFPVAWISNNAKKYLAHYKN